MTQPKSTNFIAKNWSMNYYSINSINTRQGYLIPISEDFNKGWEQEWACGLQALILMIQYLKFPNFPEVFNFEKSIGNTLMKENRLEIRNLKRSEAIASNQKKYNYNTFSNFLSVCDNLQRQKFNQNQTKWQQSQKFY